MKTKIGIIGCGVISRTYLRDIRRLYPNRLEIYFCADVDTERARQTAKEFGIPHWGSVEQLLADPEIKIAVNLTPPAFHTRINRQALLAGKNIFCEKPFALSMKDANETVELAREKGLLIGAAPDTFLCAPLKTSHRLIREGWIGTPLYGTANMMSCGVEAWHPAPAAFYQKGAGPLFDMGPYYLSAIVNLLGPIAEVRAVSGTGFPTRTAFCGPHAGENISVETPTYYSALLTLRSGVMLNFNISFDIWHSSLPMLELYGTEGTLTLPDPNMTSGMPKLFRKEQALRGVYQGTADTEPQQPFAVPDCCPEYGEYIRGVGVCELADAMETGREPRAGAALALHVTEGILGIMESARQGKPYFLQTTWERVE